MRLPHVGLACHLVQEPTKLLIQRMAPLHWLLVRSKKTRTANETARSSQATGGTSSRVSQLTGSCLALIQGLTPVPFSSPMELERDAQSQADRAAAADALLAKTADQTAKIVIAYYVSWGDRQNLERVRINANRERAQPGEFSAATACISIR